jgi:hypothetical protein
MNSLKTLITEKRRRERIFSTIYVKVTGNCIFVLFFKSEQMVVLTANKCAQSHDLFLFADTTENGVVCIDSDLDSNGKFRGITHLLSSVFLPQAPRISFISQ